MYKTLLARKKLNKSTERHNRLHGGFVHITHHWYCNNSFDPLLSSFHSFLICSKHTYLTHVIFLFNIDSCSCFSLHFLDHFTTGSDHGTDKFPVNKHLYHPWCMWFYFASWLWCAIIHCIQNV